MGSPLLNRATGTWYNFPGVSYGHGWGMCLRTWGTWSCFSWWHRSPAWPQASLLASLPHLKIKTIGFSCPAETQKQMWKQWCGLVLQKWEVQRCLRHCLEIPKGSLCWMWCLKPMRYERTAPTFALCRQPYPSSWCSGSVFRWTPPCIKDKAQKDLFSTPQQPAPPWDT